MDLRFVKLPVVAPAHYFINQSEFRAFVERSRDAYRTALDPLNNHQNWVVSDIKSVVNGPRQGGYFLIQKNNAGVKSDYSILKGYGCYSSSSTPYQSLNFIAGGSGTIAQNYYQDSSGLSNSSTLGDPGFCIHINNKALTDDYDFSFDNTTDLSYTGGDWTVQGANPINSTGMADFMPAHDLPKGFDPRTQPDISTTGFGVTWGAIVDLDSASIRYVMCRRDTVFMGAQYAFSDLFFNNFNSSDTNRDGWHFVGYNTSGDGMKVTNDVVFGLNQIGNVTLFDVITSKAFTRNSRKSRTTGSYHYLLAAGISNDYAKGTLNPDFIREQGMFEGDFNKFMASGDTMPFWKGHESLTFRYPADTLPFPFAVEEDDQVG